MPDAARKPYAGQCTRVYTRTGTRAHLMSPVQSIRNGSVLCARVLPEWFTEWHGTGSQDEIDRAASLPLCKHCEDQARREDEYYGELPQFNPPGRADRIAPGPAARGSASDADPAGVLQPPSGAPAQTSLPPAVHGAGIPGPETGEADPGSTPVSPVRARVQAPAGASGHDSPPAGSTALSGAAWRAAAKAAQSKARRGRPARSAAAKPAAKVTTPPPVTGGAALTATAACLGRCEWTAGPGDPAEVDKRAERHTTKPPKHPTNVVSVVAS